MADEPNVPAAASAPASAGDAAAPLPADTPIELIEERVEPVEVRRAPKVTVFLILGAAVGVLAALILTFAFHGTDQPSQSTGVVYSTGQVFGFLALICGIVGLALGGVVAVVLDRTVGRRVRRVVADRESVTTVD